MKYSAFISYRHGGTDEFVAKNLQKMLESYKIPASMAKQLGKNRVGRVFRDEDELPTSGSLYENIEEALKDTEFLIVICTPRLRESKWCMRELELFIELHGADHVLAVLAEGEPQDSFPEALLYREENGKRIEVEPLAADIRADSPSGMKKKMRVERLRLLAAMLSCDFDQLRQRARRRMMQRRMVIAGAAFAVVLCFLGMMTVENLKLQTEISRTQEAQSYLLSQYSKNLYQSDDRTTAALLALEGLPENLGNSRPFVSATMSTLTDVLQLYNYQQGYMADRSVTTRTVDSAYLSPDGKWLAYTDLVDGNTYNTHFYDIQSGKVMGDFPTDPNYCSYASSNEKAVFFGDNLCAIAGVDGVQVIDLSTMEVKWTGNPSTMVEVSADGSVIAGCDAINCTMDFYTADGTVLYSGSYESDYTIPYGLSGDGSMFAFNQRSDSDTLTIIDTKTGETVKEFAEKGGVYATATYTGSWKDGIFGFVYSDDTQNRCFAWYDSGDDSLHNTDIYVKDSVSYIDAENKLVYVPQGNQLEKYDMNSGETIESYSAGGSVSAALYCGDDKWEIACADGSLEYIDFSETPYCISSTIGDGSGCSGMKIGGDYIVTYIFNAYKVNLYKLNANSTAKSGTLQKLGDEQCVNIIRNDNLLCLNTSNNSYTIDMNTLEMVFYSSPISFLQLGSSQSVLRDELDGSTTVFSAADGSQKSSIPSESRIVANGAYVLDSENHQLQQYSLDTGEMVNSYELPEECSDALYINEQLVTITEDGDKSLIHVYDKDNKEILSAEIDDFNYGDDFLSYDPAGTGETVFFDMATDKELIKGEFGTVDWCMSTTDMEYLFVSTTDKGGYIINRNTGKIDLTLPDVSTVYNLVSWKDSDYFGLINISDSGSTRFDVYLKAHPDSPIAQIEGGLGINADDELLIYDGESKIYAAPILSKEEVYEKGQSFVGGQTLTDRQRTEYHCK